jgi:hypothetical protein
MKSPDAILNDLTKISSTQLDLLLASLIAFLLARLAATSASTFSIMVLKPGIVCSILR